jgi:integrase/recombinase XerD
MLLNQAIQSFEDYIKMIDRSQSTVTCYIQELGHFNDFLQVKHNGPVYLEDIVLQDLEDFMIHEKERWLFQLPAPSARFLPFHDSHPFLLLLL